ncbi:hypothetical protein A2U01_0074734, partial [Trifolium medium]|nr:hypothetical protein [Trifolium medium]
MKKAISEEANRGLPKLKNDGGASTKAVIEPVLESFNEKLPVTNVVEDAIASAGHGTLENFV